MTKPEKRDKARTLRQQGMSIKEIAAHLGVAKGSVSLWVRDITLTDAQIETLERRRGHYGTQNKGAAKNRDKFRSIHAAYQEKGRIKARERRYLHLIGCVLYWANGSKAKNDFYFVNSNANMMRLFIQFIREELEIEDQRILINIYCHDSSELERIENFWLNLLELPRENLKKTEIKTNTRKKSPVNGICGIRVNEGTEFIHHIRGAIQVYGEFDNSD